MLGAEASISMIQQLSTGSDIIVELAFGSIVVTIVLQWFCGFVVDFLQEVRSAGKEKNRKSAYIILLVGLTAKVPVVTLHSQECSKLYSEFPSFPIQIDP